MNCDQAVEAISARLDGELCAQEARELDAHLQTCAQCRALAQALSGLETELEGLDAEAPDTLVPGVMRTIRAEKKRKSRPRRTAWFIAAAAALALLLGATGVIELPGFGANHASVSIGDALSAPKSAEDTAAQLAQARGCAVLLLRANTLPAALERTEAEKLENGMRLYTVSAEVMGGIMDAQTEGTMEVYTPQETAGTENGTVCVLFVSE